MVAKRTKTTTKTQRSAAETAHALWLAGLGAFSIAQKQGSTLFTGLIAEGQDFQQRTQKFAQEIGTDARAQLKGALAPIRERVKQDAEKLGAAVQNGIAVALARLGIPSKADIDELTQRVTALSRQLKTAK